ncbi:U1 small nuclear ribonucleoprotein C [Drosophila ficusphila]|uniref:U1 small nuclear ribonucleoprotein C n=1 Tax=Drosophila ficusphila TaxID=30025 RepID=UPI0007E6C822|nr:U1 small nuclear ribonucleoprotein C [Drosophila ficusphila]
MNKFVAKKAVLLLALLILGTAGANPLDRELDQDNHVRKERQLKPAASTDADIKMVANVTPATASQGMTMAMGMPMNQMALNSVGGQLVRYPNYPGLIYPGITPPPGLNGIPGVQTNIANNFPSYPDPNLGGSLPGFNPFGYPGVPPMYGNPIPMYPNPQLPNGFVPNPAVDNFQSLNNIVNMANVQGVNGGSSGLYPAPQGYPVPAPGLYPSPQGFGGPNSGLYPASQVNMQGLYPPPGGFLERMTMQTYAPNF